MHDDSDSIDVNKLAEPIAKIRKNLGLKKENVTLLVNSVIVEKALTGKDLSNLIDHRSGYLIENGKPLLFYIQDHSVMHDRKSSPFKLNKVHFRNCSKLKEMDLKNKINSRYRVSNRTDDSYYIDLKNNVQVKRKLYFCQYCLRMSPYVSFKYQWSRERKNEALENFKARKIMSLIKLDFNMINKNYKSIRNDSSPTGYTRNWESISTNYKVKKIYVCERCEKDFINDKRLVDVHHIDCDKSNNDESNLLCLCKRCHSTFHPHYNVDRYYN